MVKTWQQALAEFVATFALVFIGVGAVIMASNPANGSGLIGVALAHGTVLVVMVSVVGHISGAHLNPAVTVSAWVTGNIKTVTGLIYIVAQLAGAAVAGLAANAVFPDALAEQAAYGIPLVNERAGVSNGAAVIIEAILTALLVFAVYGTAVDERGPFDKIAGIPIGLVLVFDILAAGPLTGAAMNPARAFGPMLASGEWQDWWVYWIGPIGGGVIGASIYWFGFLGGREKLVATRRSDRPIGGPGEGDHEEPLTVPE